MQVQPASDEWIFGSAFDVIGRRPKPNDFSYDVELLRDFTEPLIGRLRVRFWPGTRPRRLRMENYLPLIEVVEIAARPWAGRPFPGIDSINHSFRELEVIVATGRSDWRNVLDNLKGVYVWSYRDRAGVHRFGDVCDWRALVTPVRMARRLRDALTGGDSALRAAVWELMRPMLSPALIALNRAFLIEDDAVSTVDLATYRGASDLATLALGDDTADVA
ncbi:MAG: hypothetical protein ACLP01_18450 [Solirubrobacteraceae bacterium]